MFSHETVCQSGRSRTLARSSRQLTCPCMVRGRPGLAVSLLLGTKYIDREIRCMLSQERKELPFHLRPISILMNVQTTESKSANISAKL